MVIKKSWIITVAVVVLVILFIFHVPKDSLEYKVKKIDKIFAMENEEAIKDTFRKAIAEIDEEERSKVVANMSFEVVKNHKNIITKVLDDEVKNWKKLDCFNVEFLLTEDQLNARKNENLLKELKIISKLVVINSIEELELTIDNLAKSGWNIEIDDFYMISGDSKIVFTNKDKRLKLEEALLNVFDINTGYIMEISYKSSRLSIKPTVKKIKDGGFYGLSEVLSQFNLKEMLKFASYRDKPIEEINVEMVEPVPAAKQADDGKGAANSKQAKNQQGASKSVDKKPEDVKAGEDELDFDDVNKDVEDLFRAVNKNNDFTGKIKAVISDTIISELRADEPASVIYNVIKRRNKYYQLDETKDKVYVGSLSLYSLKPAVTPENPPKIAHFNIFRDNIKVR